MSLRRVLITGSNGLLGQKIAELLVRSSSCSITLASLEQKAVRELLSAEYVRFNIVSKKDVRDLVSSREPEVIIHCAAMTNVDACEEERELAWKINVEGVENVIEAARRVNAKVIHFSTDYIFNGKSGPYAEDDRPQPISYYGKTKLASENVLRASGLEFLIVRTMVLYGFAAGVRPNFALWLIQNLEKKSPVRVVDDQVGNPSLVDDVAYGVVRAMELQRCGVYNIAGREIVSRHEFAVRLAKVFGFDPSLVSPVKTVQLRQPAPRPLKSGLITLKAEVELGFKPAGIEEGLTILKNQLTKSMRRAADSAPVPGSSTPRSSTGGKQRR